jgi:hypothetical protein
MYHTIKKMEGKLTITDKNNKLINLNGYAFLDESNHCIIIVYGEGRKIIMENYLNE